MISSKKVLALIPARGGSKGIKDKNIVSLFGKPLISHTIESALKSRYIDQVVVSTDSSSIRSIALRYGARVPFIRPANLATDKAKTITAVMHAIKSLKDIGEGYDILTLLQPTQPLRNNLDLDNALEFFIKNKSRSVASICRVENNPSLIRIMMGNKLTNLINKKSDSRRQDMDKYYYVNGAIYINLISKINKDTSFNDNEFGYIMPKNRSIDIDTGIDLLVAETILSNNYEQHK
jgi:CMP-N,N'-diacetyllegionaminic acid synthase